MTVYCEMILDKCLSRKIKFKNAMPVQEMPLMNYLDEY